ncbi:tRNA (adenosine(37)-N6)-threonylcarbamoyltransferase complex dimerization subunit type 1 TsaB [Tamilnaduibacter salinus]|uniref:tRNA threonylcarbamoyladenosine biosynthesis protein TsaB n=1 Tax=Tamilnaduibacter salinus TaxID=1484056 RepID=A0A2A2I607_9GAMM|nr:tRNA (adenosine(37)-N6)-threonylcarbamoyltransferase complex dimerization subunit type 1 TsaB [Tamilnaduibacter salinus]PAV27169.1 tRNA (adenosine(37)-N6)-threonylcarbamoyltransferase complex dimerization subunit type 1 TsaB [Tamilnaduibacter salinus]
MNLLAVDTTADACSAAILMQDGRIHERCIVEPRGHTRHLLPMARELTHATGLSLSDMDALAFGRGPGSFTGLRIATGVVQGLAWGLSLPVVPVSSLATVAAGAIRQHGLSDGSGIAVAFDARMGEVYWGCFVQRDGLPEPVSQECVVAPESVTLPAGDGRPWFGAGSGWRLSDQFPASVSQAMEACYPDRIPHAADIARLALGPAESGQGVPAEEAIPVYIRDEVAWKKSRS